MDRATKVIKRSSIRLKSHSDLNMILSDLSEIRALEKSSIKAYQVFIEDLVKWSQQDSNENLKYLFSLLSDLNMLWTGIHCEFLDNLKHFKYQFDMILENEQMVDKAKDNLSNCEHYRMKLCKEAKKLAKKSSQTENNAVDIAAKLNEAERSVDIAMKDVSEKMNENEVIRVIRLKTGMMKLTEACLTLYHKCNIILYAQKDIITEISDLPEDQQRKEAKYFESDKAKYAIIRAKENIQAYNISNASTSTAKSAHAKSANNGPSSMPLEYEAPPPYYAFSNELSSSSAAYHPPPLHNSSFQQQTASIPVVPAAMGPVVVPPFSMYPYPYFPPIRSSSSTAAHFNSSIDHPAYYGYFSNFNGMMPGGNNPYADQCYSGHMQYRCMHNNNSNNNNNNFTASSVGCGGGGGGTANVAATATTSAANNNCNSIGYDVIASGINCSELAANSAPMTYICCKCSTKFTSTHIFKRVKGRQPTAVNDLSAKLSDTRIA